MEYERAVALKQFSRLWPLAAVVVAVWTISVITVSILKVADHPLLLFMAPQSFAGTIRLVQIGFTSLPGGICWGRATYRILFFSSWTTSAVAIIVYVVPYFWVGSRHSVILSISILCNSALCVGEIWFGDQFPQYMRDMRVLQCADFLAAGDASSFKQARKRKWPLMRSLRGLLRPRGPIFLPEDDSVVPDGIHLASSTREQSFVAWDIPAELSEAVLLYSRPGAASSWSTNKALWITADTGDRCSAIARAVLSIISSESGIALDVNVSTTRSVFWPLVRALAFGIPPYRDTLACCQMFDARLFQVHLCSPRSPSFSISPYECIEGDPHSLLDIVKNLVSKPLARRKYFRPGPARVALVVHGVHDQVQANELYETIRELGQEQSHEDVRLVVISSPTLLRQTMVGAEDVMQRICTLYASESCVLYSANAPTPPAFYKAIFLLLMDGIHRVGGAEAERLCKELPDFSSSAESDILPEAEDDPSRSTLSLFSKLYTASEIRRKILECLSEVKVVPRSQINKALVEDNIKVAEMLQRLCEIRSYREDVPALPKEHAVAVLNLTHYILDGGLPETEVIYDYDIFARLAHLLLNRLAQYLRLLPDAIAINSVVLLGEHPIKHGGFSNIYRGIYTNPAGEQVEVALKVLKIFEDQSDECRHILHDKFSKEALVWHCLKHKNIVPFLGVDFTTFRSPARAMVSPWMPDGSVLKYMVENSPSFPYALELLCDVNDGLSYLHSMNLVHGDLCGRNILMDSNGCACLTDFGLATFIESDTSIKASTRSGSTRWMAPELLLPTAGVHFKRTPASDVWAFGCVCCEIWSEGTTPFSYIGADTGVLFALSGGDAIPYLSKPHDKAGNPMPDRLWELTQWCWNHEPSERPNGQVISEVLAEMNRAHAKNPKGIRMKSVNKPIASTSGSGRVHPADEAGEAPAPTLGSGKGKKRVHFPGFATVHFGPINIDGDPDEVFETILDGLLNLIEREVMVDPVAVEVLDSNHLALRFRSPVEANNFAMTWMMNRFEPFKQVLAKQII